MNNKDIFFISFSAFILSIIILLFHIQEGEVQPWDEGLYAYRARAILETNQWWDQVDISLGGLYSATYPPLVPVVMALNMKIFGINLFAIRLFSVLCSATIIFLFIYFFAKFFDYQYSFLFGINILLSYHWLYYSRQGMTDVPLILLIFLTIIFTLKYAESIESKPRFAFGILISICFYLALMTKIVISFIPMITLLFIYKYFNKRTFTTAAQFYSLGFVAALPWYCYMSIKYGSTFISSLFPPHLFSIVESNTKPLGPFYYINQILISNPLLMFSYINVICRFSGKKLQNIFFTHNIVSDIFFFWFFIGLIVLSLAPTKLEHYTLYLIFPAYYLVLEFFSLKFNKISHSGRTLLFALFLLNIFWYFSPNFRRSSQSLYFEQFPFSILLLGFAFLLLVIIYVIERNTKADHFFSSKSIFMVSYIITISILIVTLLGIAHKPTGKVFGGEETAKFLIKNNVHSFVYIFHKVNDSDTLNPQLSWYTKGLFAGKKPNTKITYIPIPLNKLGLEEIKRLQDYPDEYVVYYTYDRKIPRRILVEAISMERKILLVTPNYVVFGKKERQVSESEIKRI